jgi:uncharacterized short protein YbdD (DUF466 family)
MKSLLATLRETALLMIGQPNYAAYLAHMAAHHPERRPMTRIEFFRDREQARYGAKGGGRCC